MNTSTSYKTKQRALVEGVLRENAGRHLTAEEVVDILALGGSPVGRTTVYRCLERLIEEGSVQKYAAAAGESACYQYLADDGCHEHFHLKCTGCGRLIHIECKHIGELSRHIASEHGFKVDKLKTVLYGLCEECAAG